MSNKSIFSNKFLYLLLIVLLTSCTNSHQKSFLNLKNAFIKWYLMYNPEKALAFGYPLDPDLKDFSSINENIADINRFKIELSQIDYTRLRDLSLLEFYSIKEHLDFIDYKYNYKEVHKSKPSIYIETLSRSIQSILKQNNFSEVEKISSINKLLVGSEKLFRDCMNNIKVLTIKNKEIFIEDSERLIELLNNINNKLFSSDPNDLEMLNIYTEMTISGIKELQFFFNDAYYKKQNIKKLFDKEVFDLIIGKKYSFNNMYLIASKKIKLIQNQIFDISLKHYLQYNDEPIWVDRQDTLNVISWTFDFIDEKHQKQDLSNTLVESNKKIFNYFNKIFFFNDLLSSDLVIEMDENNYFSEPISFSNNHFTGTKETFCYIQNKLDETINSFDSDLYTIKNIIPRFVHSLHYENENININDLSFELFSDQWFYFFSNILNESEVDDFLRIWLLRDKLKCTVYMINEYNYLKGKEEDYTKKYFKENYFQELDYSKFLFKINNEEFYYSSKFINLQSVENLYYKFRNNPSLPKKIKKIFKEYGLVSIKSLTKNKSFNE
ncbi:MAG: hypothetical protein CBD58_00015 [bacterium TMED198]|nr:MAG: hypothetical protein CBD58_00015 [bacterium TMED198]